jgi:hypothetical protein
MRKSILCLSALALLAAPTPILAETVSDAVGDFLPGFIGPNSPDLDVTSFSVDFDGTNFNIGASFAGTIDSSVVGFYVIGVNTGTGVIRPFASVGQPNVIFNQAAVVRKDGTGVLGAITLDPASIVISGDSFTLALPLALLPTTGFDPFHYGFNIWPRVALGNNNQISDFSPENATLDVAVPEPASWAMLVAGFGLLGAALRRRERKLATAGQTG